MLDRDTAVKVENLSKRFGGIIALENISIEIPRGMITCLLGPNGSGKSTLFNLLTGYLKFDSGSVEFDSGRFDFLAPRNNRRRNVARTFQEVRLFNQMTVRENLYVGMQENRFPLSVFEYNTDAMKRRADELLEIVGLTEKATVLAEQLSYGQRKLLEVARTLASNAEILFFDEPFAGMFFARAEIVKKVLLDLKREGKTIVLVEHNMELISKVAEYVIVLHHGKLLAEGTFEEISRDESVLSAYLGR